MKRGQDLLRFRERACASLNLVVQGSVFVFERGDPGICGRSRLLKRGQGLFRFSERACASLNLVIQGSVFMFERVNPSVCGRPEFRVGGFNLRQPVLEGGDFLISFTKTFFLRVGDAAHIVFKADQAQRFLLSSGKLGPS